VVSDTGDQISAFVLTLLVIVKTVLPLPRSLSLLSELNNSLKNKKGLPNENNTSPVAECKDKHKFQQQIISTHALSPVENYTSRPIQRI